MKELTHISLFAGIGGIDIAAEWAGFRTILFVEIDPFCQRVLNKHWPDVPIIGDIRDVTKEIIADATSQRLHNQENKQELEGEGGDKLHLEQSRVNRAERSETISIPTITLITGGFPCQPVSQAGKRRGKEDDRWVWPEMLRVISKVRPTWVVAENVTGLLHLGFYNCLSDLEGAGYETIPFVIPACGVNAPHRRDRIFIVAHYEGRRLGQELNKFAGKLLPKDRTPQEFESSSGDVANTSRERLQGNIHTRDSEAQGTGIVQRGEITRRISQADVLHTEHSETSRQRKDSGEIYRQPESTGPDITSGFNWWAVEPDVGRVAYGIPNRVDRLRALGNAVVPQQIYPILKAIADIENGIASMPKCYDEDGNNDKRILSR